VLVERELGDQTLKPRVLIAQLTHLPDLRHAELAVLLLPQVEARLAHAQLPAHVDHGRPALSLAQRVGDLLFRKPLALHAHRLLWWETSEPA
jgi:hypothetical protein